MEQNNGNQAENSSFLNYTSLPCPGSFIMTYQMETFSTLLDLCDEFHRSPVNSHHKGQWRGALVFSQSHCKRYCITESFRQIAKLSSSIYFRNSDVNLPGDLVSLRATAKNSALTSYFWFSCDMIFREINRNRDIKKKSLGKRQWEHWQQQT